MVAKVISGKNIRGLLNYNENKVAEGVAYCIAASSFGCEAGELTFSNKLNRFSKVIKLNRKVKTNAIHISLNFAVHDKLTDEKLSTIAADYMARIGFGDQPFLVYKHMDAAHPHVHIISTNIKSDGKRIDIHNIGRNQSDTARKAIEDAYGLVRAETSKPERIIDLPVPPKVVYGKSETKRSLTNVVGFVIGAYKFTSLPEFNAILGQFHVFADRGEPGTPIYIRSGLVYSIINEKGQKLGVPIKASAIHGKPTLANLEKQFKLNEILRKGSAEGLRTVINNALQGASKTEFIDRLGKQNILALFRENKDGLIYGVTFVDNNQKVVFNGSHLGKMYSAAALLKRFNNHKEERHRTVTQRDDDAVTDHPHGIQLGIEQFLKDLTSPERPDYSMHVPAAMRRRKRRKKKGKSI